MDWYYTDGKTVFGPHTEAVMMELRARGVLADNTLVARGGANEWVHVGGVFPQDAVGTSSIRAVVKFDCTGCAAKLSAASEQEGQIAVCPSCGCDVAIPRNNYSSPKLKPVRRRALPVTATADALISSQLGRTRSAACVSAAAQFSISRLAPLFICCIFFGWGGANIIGRRAFASEILVRQAIPVMMIGAPALIFACLSICFFIRPARIPRWATLGTFFFTLCFGLSGLLIFQVLAEYSLHSSLHLHGKGAFIQPLLMFIGSAYRSIDEADLKQRLFGFVFGVGYCEEMTKLLPLFYLGLRSKGGSAKIDFRSFLVLGFISGLGFGVGEAIISYAPWNGSPLVGSNIIRWFACIPSHAIYALIDASFLWVLAPRIKAVEVLFGRVALCSLAVFLVALVHGGYNLLCAVPNVGLLFDAVSIFLMYFVVVWSSAPNTPRGKRAEEGKRFSGGVTGWIKSPTYGLAELAIVSVVSAVMICFSLAFSSPVRAANAATPASSNSQEPSGGYQANDGDRELFRQFNKMYEVSSLLGRRNGWSELTVLVGALNATDWRGASPDLENAVRGMKSLNGGEDLEGRGRKMDDFINISSRY